MLNPILKVMGLPQNKTITVLEYGMDRTAAASPQSSADKPVICPPSSSWGAGKSGTTSLYEYLKQHPDIYMSPVKEPLFFAYEEGQRVTYVEPGGLKVRLPRNNIAPQSIGHSFENRRAALYWVRHHQPTCTTPQPQSGYEAV